MESTMDDSGKKVGVIIQDSWTKEAKTIHNMRVVNTDMSSYLQREPSKILQ